MGDSTVKGDVNAEVDFIKGSLETFADEMLEDLRNPGERQARINKVATLVVEFFHMIDSVDYRTSPKAGGTYEIQTYTQEGLETARSLNAQIKQP